MNPGDPELLGDSEYQSLLNRLNARYPIETINVTFGGNDFFFTRVLNPGDVPLDLDENGELRWQPYWADDWESSRALCNLLLSEPINERNVLDLGCGLGLTGAVAASRGAMVTMVDNADPALEFSELNCWRWRERCQFRNVDWKQKESALPRFDWIVGAEIIYDSGDWADLDSFWKRHIAPDGRVLLCDPFRKTGRDFRQWIMDRNWKVEFSEREIPEMKKAINVIELHWCQ